MERQVVWEAADGGRETLGLRVGPQGVHAESTLEFTAAGHRGVANYTLECDASWRTRRLHVEVEAADGHRAVSLTADGEGAWRDADGPRPDLAGALDVDLSATPFTNTLPLRRLAMRRRQSVDVEVAMVEVPSLRVLRLTQRFTCLRPGKAYRLEQPTTGSAHTLTVDGDFLVMGYSGLFRRVTG
jgi:hypothetical protein